MEEALITKLTARIVVSYLGAHRIASGDVAPLTGAVYSVLTTLEYRNSELSHREVQKPTPAQIRNSVQPDYLVSFLDGKRYRSIRRHLRTHGYTFEQYRALFELPLDYPAVCSNSSKARSDRAKAWGFGIRHRRPTAQANTGE